MAIRVLVMKAQTRAEVETVQAQATRSSKGRWLAAHVIGGSETTSGRDTLCSNRGAGKGRFTTLAARHAGMQCMQREGAMSQSQSASSPQWVLPYPVSSRPGCLPFSTGCALSPTAATLKPNPLLVNAQHPPCVSSLPSRSPSRLTHSPLTTYHLPHAVHRSIPAQRLQSNPLLVPLLIFRCYLFSTQRELYTAFQPSSLRSSSTQALLAVYQEGLSIRLFPLSAAVGTEQYHQQQIIASKKNRPFWIFAGCLALRTLSLL